MCACMYVCMYLYVGFDFRTTTLFGVTTCIANNRLQLYHCLHSCELDL